MSKYFSTAKAFGAQNFSNYSGYSNVLATGFSSADASMGAGVGESEPYNFNIANASTVDVSNVVLLGAFENTAAGVTNFGNASSITVSMDNGDITYGVFLQSLKTNPFNVGQVYLSSQNSSQLTKTLNITYKEGNGKTTTIQIYPKLDPMQNLTTALNQYKEFPVDGFTQITTTILASATLSISLYPKMVLSTANNLVGQRAEQAFGRPNLSQMRLG